MKKNQVIKNQKGLTAIELVAVLVVVSAILYFALPKILNLFSTNDDNTFRSDIATLKSGADRYRLGRNSPFFTGISCPTLLSGRYIETSWAACDTANPVGGSYQVAAATDARNLVITVGGLSTDRCTRLREGYTNVALSATCAGTNLTITMD